MVNRLNVQQLQVKRPAVHRGTDMWRDMNWLYFIYYNWNRESVSKYEGGQRMNMNNWKTNEQNDNHGQDKYVAEQNKNMSTNDTRRSRNLR